MIMGETAEVLARQYGITREESEAYALETQRKAGARDRGRTASRTRSRRSPSPDAKGKARR